MSRRKGQPVTAFGITKYISEWANDERCVVPFQTLFQRLKRGTPPEIAIAKKEISRKPRTVPENRYHRDVEKQTGLFKCCYLCRAYAELDSLTGLCSTNLEKTDALHLCLHYELDQDIKINGNYEEVK